MGGAFDVVARFEEAVADYSGSKYAVAVDSCTNAIFLSLQFCDVSGHEITIPCRTYPSIPCSIIHAGAKVNFEDITWSGIYQLKPFPIIDGAKRFKRGMYEKGTLHCLSFHIKKLLDIGRGGAILTDDYDTYSKLKRMRFDGRRECHLREDTLDMLGWNFYMTPEQAARGLWLMMSMPDYNDDQIEDPDYPDLSQFPIYRT